MNINETSENIGTRLTQPGSADVLSTYTLRREAIAARLKATEPRRSQLGILIEMCDRRDPGAFAAIARQIGVMNGTVRTTAF